MDIAKLHAMLQNPSAIGPEEARWLDEVIAEYPFFNAPRWLHLHWLNRQGSFKYNQELKRVAIQSGNRERLRQFVLAEPEKRPEGSPRVPLEQVPAPIEQAVQEVQTPPVPAAPTAVPVERKEPKLTPAAELQVPAFLAEANQAQEEKRQQALEAAKRMIELNRRIRMQLDATSLPDLEEVAAAEPVEGNALLESTSDQISTELAVEQPVENSTEPHRHSDSFPPEGEVPASGASVPVEVEENNGNDGWTGSFPAVLPGMVAMEVEQPEEVMDEVLPVKKLDQAVNQKHTFADWLRLSKGDQIDVFHFEPTPDEPVVPLAELDPSKKAKFDLIDQFISQQPQLRPKKSKLDVPQVNMAALSAREESGPVTETLARVYVEQKHYEAAIQAYEILRLKYPEKSSFFATQISAIRKLMT